MQDLTRRMAKGAAWMVLARMLDRSVGFISTIILARLLVPADFGLVSLATAILAGLELLGAFSFDMALIQKQNADRRHYDTVWTITLLFAVLFAAVMVLLAHPAARFFDDARLASVMQLLAIGVLAGGFSNVGVVAFRKELKFDREFKFLFTKRLISFAVTVALAFQWRDYRALVAGTVTGMVVGVVISYWMHPYRPRLTLAALGELFGFSRWMFANNTLAFAYHRAADFIVAKGIGTESLGYYSVAYEISNLPYSEIAMPINRAMFPGYAKMSEDLASLRQGFINVVSVMSLVVIPVAVGIACVAYPAVELMLGVRWLSIAPLIQVLAFNGVLTALLSCCGSVYLALGKPRHVTLVLGAHVAMAVPLIAWSAYQFDITAVARALLCASFLLIPVNYWLLTRTIRINALDLVAVLWRPVVGAAVMAAGVIWCENVIPFGSGFTGTLSKLLFLVSVGAVTYVAMVTLLWRAVNRPAGAEAFIWGQVIQRVRAWKKAD